MNRRVPVKSGGNGSSHPDIVTAKISSPKHGKRVKSLPAPAGEEGF